MTDGAGVPTGTPLTDPPLVEMISEDPVLRDTKLIAEAWDCDGLNQARHGPEPRIWYLTGGRRGLVLCAAHCETRVGVSQALEERQSRLNQADVRGSNSGLRQGHTCRHLWSLIRPVLVGEVAPVKPSSDQDFWAMRKLRRP